MKFKWISFSCSVIISDDLEVGEGGGDGAAADIVLESFARRDFGL
jgi:hypothetical protein